MNVTQPRRQDGSGSQHDLYDIAIVGYGPTGMMLAAFAGQLGWRVAVLERYRSLYNLPRAATFDDEIMRMFQKLALVQQVLPGVVAQPDYEWVNADGETLVHLQYDDPSTGGWAALYQMYQPYIETVLDRHCKMIATVNVTQGVTVTGLEQSADSVSVHGVNADGQEVDVRARYLVGADGGSSFVRRELGVGVFDYGFQENWLVSDFAMRPRARPVPTFRQVCDPAQPLSIVRIGPRHHRFSCMLDPDEDRERALDQQRVWERIGDYLSPDDAELIRVANYVFRSRIVDRWRVGRVLLAGDAAHEMPPFLGQGMCSGMRDAHNLAWKLDLVLQGRAGSEILDTYQPEREPHVRAYTERAIELGRVQTLRDPVAARGRDDELLKRRRTNQEPEKIQAPTLGDGFAASGEALPHAGVFFVQGHVRSTQGDGLLDDVIGSGPCVITRSADLLGSLTTDALDAWRSLGGHLVSVDEAGHYERLPAGVVTIKDSDEVYERWFSERNCGAVILRPDWYVYGTARSADILASAVEEMISGLSAPRYRLPKCRSQR